MRLQLYVHFSALRAVYSIHQLDRVFNPWKRCLSVAQLHIICNIYGKQTDKPSDSKADSDNIAYSPWYCRLYEYFQVFSTIYTIFICMPLLVVDGKEWPRIIFDTNAFHLSHRISKRPYMQGPL